MSRKTNPRATSTRQLRPGSLQLAGTPGAPDASLRQSLDSMTPAEARFWLASLRERLQQKMARERAYLDRRAARGTHTPTDDAYKEDQGLEAELLSLLDQWMQAL